MHDSKKMYSFFKNKKVWELFMEKNIKLRNAGLLSFFFSGICAISSGVIVSLLQDKYGFAYGMTGTLLSCMSIGNMAASFAAGILPGKIGTRNTVLLLCSGYFIGYTLMAVTGILPVLIMAFALAGIAKGCALNNCTVLVGDNSVDRTQGMSLMHACYACGALLCPILIALFQRGGTDLPMIGIALIGVLLWLTFMLAGLPGKKKETLKEKEKTDLSFLKSRKFWMITALIFCQLAAETSVTGWMVTYYKGQNILSGIFSTYTVTVMWTATLIARLLIAFVFPVKNTFRSLTFMGVGCTIMYSLMIFAGKPVSAILMLFAFAFSMAGVNPVAIAGVGKIMNHTSMGVLLPVSGIGSILMPWIIGIVADHAGLKAAMLMNLIPCMGIAILSFLLLRMKEQA